jgi:hypothetical protein
MWAICADFGQYDLGQAKLLEEVRRRHEQTTFYMS